jgi:hypothetical protein
MPSGFELVLLTAMTRSAPMPHRDDQAHQLPA